MHAKSSFLLHLRVIGLLCIGLSACGAPKLVDSTFCKLSAINQFAKSGGPSAPIDLKLSDGQIVVISYVAEWGSGAVSFELWDEDGIPIWNVPAQKSSTVLTLKTPSQKAGKYRLINVAEDATNGTICMSEKIE